MQVTLDDSIIIQLADYVYPPGHRLAGQRGLVNGFVVRHPGGVLLSDTGMGTASIPIPGFAPTRRDLVQALASLGIGLGEVRMIANSHLHFDHCGGNRLFPGVPIYVQRRERENGQRPGYTLDDYVSFDRANYMLLDNDANPLEGVRILATPGHTSGHQSIAIEAGEGTVVLAGHAVYSREEWIGASPEETSETARRSAARLHALRPRRVLFGHDDAIWDARLERA